MAYNVGPSSSDFNQAASLSFVSLNRNAWVAAQRPGFWVANKTLMLDTPAKVRVVSGGKVDLQIPPRSPTFIGSVAGQSLNPIPSNIASNIVTTHPETGAAINSADTFLRTVPSVGGGQSIIRLRAVKIIKYYIVKDTQTQGYKTTPSSLYRVVYENGSFSQPQMLADKIDRFTLRRDSVLKRMIYFKVNKAEAL
jgi:hypothetical protein